VLIYPNHSLLLHGKKLPKKILRLISKRTMRETYLSIKSLMLQ
jgi:hypothetical protein